MMTIRVQPTTLSIIIGQNVEPLVFSRVLPGNEPSVFNTALKGIQRLFLLSLLLELLHRTCEV